MRLHAKYALFICTLLYLSLLVLGGLKVRIAFQVPHEPATASAFIAQNGGAISWGSFYECLSAIPLGLFMAVCVTQLRSAEIRSAGEEIASLGAAGTPLMLVASALATWSLTDAGVAASSGAVRTLQAIAFDTGGPGFAVFLGMFVAGVTIAAAFSRRAPCWLTGLGAFVACAGLLSSLRLLSFAGGYIIPVARSLSIVWMVAVASTLPRTVVGKEDG